MEDQREAYGISAFIRQDVRLLLGVGLLYLGTFVTLWSHYDWHQFIFATFLAPILVWLSIRDFRTFELPDIGTFTVVIIALIHVALSELRALSLNIPVAIGVTAIFWLVGEVYFRRTGEEGIGIGDAKLFGAGSLLLGPSQIPELILLPSLGGIVFHVLSNLRGRTPNQGIPFGPFIAYAMFTLSFFEPIFL